MGGVLLQGDPIFLEPPSGLMPTDPPRTLVWGCDQRGIAHKHAARSGLKIAAHDAFEACRAHSSVRHLILAYRADIAMISTLHRLARVLATRLHTEIELRTGSDVDVVVLDVSAVDDPDLLHARLNELCGHPVGIAGAAALEWRDICDEGIHRAANDDYL